MQSADFSYKALRLLLKGVGRIPFPILYGISDVMYLFLHYVMRYRRKVVRKNLSECFPDKTEKELRCIERGFYRFLTDNILETCKMGSMSAEEMTRRMNFVNIEEVNKVLRNGRSVALYLGHYGNWEWISSMPISLEKDAVTAQIYHKLNKEGANRAILENRAAHGATNVEMRRTARFITDMVTQRRVSIVGFIADQSPRRSEIQYYLPFLNHRTPVTIGTEKIARHYDFDVWFVDVVRVKRGFYEARFLPMSSEPKKLPEYALTELYYQMLEKMIRRAPELYLWTHKRFRYAEPLTDKDNIHGN